MASNVFPFLNTGQMFAVFHMAGIVLDSYAILNLLQHKLDHYGIRGKTGEWIKIFLSDRSQSVVIEGESSDKILVESRVPQGSVLGTSLSRMP
jgi:hypothetical protein